MNCWACQFGTVTVTCVMQMNVEQAALSTTPTTYLLFHCIFHHPEIKSVYLNHPKILPETCYAFLPPDIKVLCC